MEIKLKARRTSTKGPSNEMKNDKQNIQEIII